MHDSKETFQVTVQEVIMAINNASNMLYRLDPEIGEDGAKLAVIGTVVSHYTARYPECDRSVLEQFLKDQIECGSKSIS